MPDVSELSIDELYDEIYNRQEQTKEEIAKAEQEALHEKILSLSQEELLAAFDDIKTILEYMSDSMMENFWNDFNPGNHLHPKLDTLAWVLGLGEAEIQEIKEY